jgi:RNA polymerase sigma-70 factor, ECF subfamily
LSKYHEGSNSRGITLIQDISEEILTEAAEGDLKSFEIIYRSASGFVYNVAYRIVHNKQDAEELTQEVFLNVYRNLKTFRFQSSFKTWIYRITANCAINYAKKISREKDRKKEYHENLNPWKAVTESKIDSQIHKESVGLLLKTLNTDQRMCVVLRNIEGLSYQEIADTLKISINTVRSRLKRAREKLLAMRGEVIKNEL